MLLMKWKTCQFFSASVQVESDVKDPRGQVLGFVRRQPRRRVTRLLRVFYGTQRGRRAGVGGGMLAEGDI